MLFLDLLHECEGVHEGKLYAFAFIYLRCQSSKYYFIFSGGEAVPLFGYETQPSLHFSGFTILPTASTCALSLTLPTRYHNNPPTFEEKIFAILNHGGFGLH